jgi:hypothetical protein
MADDDWVEAAIAARIERISVGKVALLCMVFTSSVEGLRKVVAHTGHSSQLFPVTTGRNAQFLATGERRTLRTVTKPFRLAEDLLCQRLLPSGRDD